MIETFFTLSEAEYVECQRLYLSQKTKRWRRWRLPLYAIYLIGVFAFLWTTRNAWDALIFITLALIGIIALAFLAKSVLQTRIYRQRFKTESRMLTDAYLSIDDSGIHSKVNGIGEGNAEWNAYTSWLEGKTAFVLFAGYTLRPIPKSTLSEEDQKELRDLLTRKIAPIGVIREL